MDRTEQHALAYMTSRFPEQEIIYEPDGNVPPDFLIGQTIAIEVRRLNQHDRRFKLPRGLEEAEFHLRGKMQTLLAGFGPAQKVGWWVLIEFKRPVPRWRRVESEIRNILQEALNNTEEKIRVRVGENLAIELLQKEVPADHIFDLGGFNDLDQGGWVIDEMERNIRICIQEKSHKTAPFRSRYQEWWLVLVDHVLYGMTETSRRFFKENVSIIHDWDRITIVDPINHRHYFDL